MRTDHFASDAGPLSSRRHDVAHGRLGVRLLGLEGNGALDRDRLFVAIARGLPSIAIS
jgi:hypothetical protein